jgi:peroxidase
MRELEGLIKQKCAKADTWMANDLTNSLFQGTAESKGDDLAARNIQRGRDHGMPGYNEFRKHCGLQPLSTDWANTPSDVEPQDWANFKLLYRSPMDIDAFSGGLSERHVPGGLVGPTFACIIGQQFEALLYGDRYFFSHAAAGAGLAQGLGTSNTRRMAQRRTLGDIICDNTDLKETQRDVMLHKGRGNIPCRDGIRKQHAFDFEKIVDDIIREKAILLE